MSKEPKPCACQGGTLSKFIQPIILTILDGEEMTGYRIVQEIGAFSTFRHSKPDPTGVYRYLKTMEEKGLISNRAPAGADSCYTITEHGRWCLNNWRLTLPAYIHALKKLCQELDAPPQLRRFEE